jgi:hypothetical protein
VTVAHWRRIAGFRGLFTHKHAEDDLAREVASHLTLLADDFGRRGMSPEEASLAARRAYGNVELTKQAHRDERTFYDIKRESRSFQRMTAFEYPHDSDLPGGVPQYKTTQVWLPLALNAHQMADRDNASGNAAVI